MVVNPFQRVTLNALMGGGAGYGDWPTHSFNISNAIANSRGKPIDWWVRGNTAGDITNGIRKASSPNLFTVSVLQPPGGTVNLGNLTAWGDGTVTWTDGPTGAGSTTNAHALGDASEGAGAGFRISVPASQWPDWWLLKVWTRDVLARRMHYRASLDNPLASADEVWIDYYGPGPGPNDYPEEYLDWGFAAPTGKATTLFTTEVLFAADAPGQTLTYDITRTWEYYPSIYAAALYKAAIVPRRRGALVGLVGDGYASPSGK